MQQDSVRKVQEPSHLTGSSIFGNGMPYLCLALSPTNPACSRRAGLAGTVLVLGRSGASTVAAFGDEAEAIKVVAAWRSDSKNRIPAQERPDGKTFLDGWRRAQEIGSDFALAGTFNEWANPSEDPSTEVSKDIEPS